MRRHPKQFASIVRIIRWACVFTAFMSFSVFWTLWRVGSSPEMGMLTFFTVIVSVVATVFLATTVMQLPEEWERDRGIELGKWIELIWSSTCRVGIMIARLLNFSGGAYGSQRISHSPRAAVFLLYIFLSRKDREPIIGDMEEDFITNVLPKFGPWQASLWYWAQAVQTVILRNVICRWLLIGGGLLKIGSWLLRKNGS